MFTTIQEGLQVYRAKLAQYKELRDRMVKMYGTAHPIEYSSSDYEEIKRENAYIQAMVATLGLTKEEERELDVEFGLA